MFSVENQGKRDRGSWRRVSSIARPRSEGGDLKDAVALRQMAAEMGEDGPRLERRTVGREAGSVPVQSLTAKNLPACGAPANRCTQSMIRSATQSMPMAFLIGTSKTRSAIASFDKECITCIVRK